MTTALLLLDMQPGLVELHPHGERVVENLSLAREHARRAEILTIYSRISLRGGSSDVSPRNAFFSTLMQSGIIPLDDEKSADQIHAGLMPRGEDVVVLKRRFSAFSGSDLDVVLRANDVATLVMGGISTSGVVLSTVRAAADMDYELFVLRDGCTDRNLDVEAVLMDEVIPRQATVLTVAEWMSRTG